MKNKKTTREEKKSNCKDGKKKVKYRMVTLINKDEGPGHSIFFRSIRYSFYSFFFLHKMKSNIT